MSIINEALDLLKSRPMQGLHGHVLVGVGPAGRDGDLPSLARHVREHGGVGLWLLQSDWMEEAYEILREANSIGLVQIHARPLNKVCAVPVDLLYVNPVGGLPDIAEDPYVKLYRDARHLLTDTLIAVAGEVGGQALVSILLAAGWQSVGEERADGALLLERRWR